MTPVFLVRILSSNRPATGRHHRHDQLGRVLASHVHQTGMAQRDSSKEYPECRLRVRPRGRSQRTHRRKPRPQNQHAKLARAKSPPSNFDRVAFSAETGAKKGVASRAGYDALLSITARSIEIPCPNHKSRFACWSLKMTKPHDRPPLGHCGNTCTPSSKPPMAQQASR